MGSLWGTPYYGNPVLVSHETFESGNPNPLPAPSTQQQQEWIESDLARRMVFRMKQMEKRDINNRIKEQKSIERELKLKRKIEQKRERERMYFMKQLQLQRDAEHK